jgi:phosphatidylserine decarboxylase
MIVAGIDTVWTHRFSGHGRRVLLEDFTGADVSLDAGAEMGRFYLGSTVVLLFEPGWVEWLEELAPGDNVRMGAAIGRRLLP